MTAWRPGSFVKAAAHFERATTCLTRSLSMFRLVGVGSRPDLLAVVVCAKSTKLAVTLAQGGREWPTAVYIIRSSSGGTQAWQN